MRPPRPKSPRLVARVSVRLRREGGSLSFTVPRYIVRLWKLEPGARLIVRSTDKGILLYPRYFLPYVGSSTPLHRRLEMLDTPEITQTSARQTAVIHVTVPRTDVQKVMGPGIQELMSTVSAQGIGPAGPWFTHHLRKPSDTFDFEISVPVTAPVTPEGRVEGSEWPAMKVARAVYRGPYEGLGAAWGEFDAWVKASGHKAGSELWEVYVAGPESGSDPEEWRTELNRPLIG